MKSLSAPLCILSSIAFVMAATTVAVAQQFTSLASPNFMWLGSNPPIIGDVKGALKYDALGEQALAAGNIVAAKEDFEQAKAHSLTEQGALLGIARCSAALGDNAIAEMQYRELIGSNLRNPPCSIDLLTEYTLFLQRTGNIREAISMFNRALHFSEHLDDSTGNLVMDTYPSDFAADGSDYRANDLAAVTYKMQALNLQDSRPSTIRALRQAAMDTSPNSPIVQHYAPILLENAEKTESDTSTAGTSKKLGP